MIVVRGFVRRGGRRAAVANALSMRTSFASPPSSSLIAPRCRNEPCHRFFGSAQPTSADVESSRSRIVSTEDVHKEEKRRGRLSDVSLFLIFRWMKSSVGRKKRLLLDR